MVAGISNFAVLSKTLFADVFYSDDPVSDTNQPKYVDQSAVGYYGRLVDLAHGGRRHGHTDDGMLWKYRTDASVYGTAFVDSGRKNILRQKDNIWEMCMDINENSLSVFTGDWVFAAVSKTWNISVVRSVLQYSGWCIRWNDLLDLLENPGEKTKNRKIRKIRITDQMESGQSFGSFFFT